MCEREREKDRERQRKTKKSDGKDCDSLVAHTKTHIQKGTNEVFHFTIYTRTQREE